MSRSDWTEVRGRGRGRGRGDGDGQRNQAPAWSPRHGGPTFPPATRPPSAGVPQQRPLSNSTMPGGHDQRYSQHQAPGRGVGSQSPTFRRSEAQPPPHAQQQCEGSSSRGPHQGPNHPQRSGGGNSGGPVLGVWTNHLQVTVLGDNKELEFRQYDVSIAEVTAQRLEVPVTSQTLSRKLMKQLLESRDGDAFQGHTPVYDGRSCLFSVGRCIEDEKEYSVSLDTKEYSITIKDTGAVKLPTDPMATFDHKVIQMLDIALRERFIGVDHAQFGRCFFPENDAFKDHGVRYDSVFLCRRGFFQSIRPTCLGLTLNVDVTATAFYSPDPVAVFIERTLGGNRYQTEHHARVAAALRNLKVRVTHRAQKREYRVLGLSPKPLRTQDFEKDGGTMLVCAYFQEKYPNLGLSNLDIPCVMVGRRNPPTYLPVCLCTIAPDQRPKGKLDSDLLDRLRNQIGNNSGTRAQNIKDTVRDNNYAREPNARTFGISISSHPILVKSARCLPEPGLNYKHGPVRTLRNGGWNANGQQLHEPAPVINWICVQTCPNLKDTNKFCRLLEQKCHRLGMAIAECAQPYDSEYLCRNGNVTAQIKNIEEGLAKLKGAVKIDIVLVIVPPKWRGYGKLKWTLETRLGLMSQFCSKDHVRVREEPGRLDQYMTNVAMKINFKLRGRNVVLREDNAVNKYFVNNPEAEYDTVVMGADVSHPGRGDPDAKSIAAVVATRDKPHFVKYAGRYFTQECRKEMMDRSKLTDVVADLVGEGRTARKNGIRVLFYRDGVSEGQFSQVKNEERPAIQEACRRLGYETVLITLVIVQKRHHTRFFGERNQNVAAGTVVDGDICHPGETNFYLCSHAAIKGTSRPAHYHVLYDDNRFSKRNLELLTYNMCHTFARCTRSVSIVPPAYYAHHLAERARQYMEAAEDDAVAARPDDEPPRPTDNLRSSMFFC